MALKLFFLSIAVVGCILYDVPSRAGKMPNLRPDVASFRFTPSEESVRLLDHAQPLHPHDSTDYSGNLLVGTAALRDAFSILLRTQNGERGLVRNLLPTLFKPRMIEALLLFADKRDSLAHAAEEFVMQPVHDGLVRALLYYAVRRQSTVVLDFFIRNGVSPNALVLPLSNQTLLHLAVRYNRQEIVQLLLDRGADITRPTHIDVGTGEPIRFNALNIAVREGNVALTRLFLAYGATFASAPRAPWGQPIENFELITNLLARHAQRPFTLEQLQDNPGPFLPMDANTDAVSPARMGTRDWRALLETNPNRQSLYHLLGGYLMNLPLGGL